MTTSMEKFWDLLENYPFAKNFWDLKNESVDLEAIKEKMGVLSHGQQVMLKFLVAVFTRVDHFNFSILDAAAVLGPEDIDRITAWLKAPFWP